MSRTFHHSHNWNRAHRFAVAHKRGYCYSPRTGEAPGWYVRLFDERPGRRADRVTLSRVSLDIIDAEAAVFIRNGNRKPHTWYF